MSFIACQAPEGLTFHSKALEQQLYIVPLHSPLPAAAHIPCLCLGVM